MFITKDDIQYNILEFTAYRLINTKERPFGLEVHYAGGTKLQFNFTSDSERDDMISQLGTTYIELNGIHYNVLYFTAYYEETIHLPEPSYNVIAHYGGYTGGATKLTFKFKTEAERDDFVAAIESINAGGGSGGVGPRGPKGDKGDQGEPGPMGPTGPQGPAGADGQDGTDGVDGAQGPQGIQGPKGDKGDGFAIVKIYDNADDMVNDPNPVNDGQMVGVIYTNDAGELVANIYIKNPLAVDDGVNKNGYTFFCNLADATVIQGPKGDTGAQGPVGPAGANGANGADGATGATGPQGPVGPQGPAGTNGTDGTDGISVTNATINSSNHLIITLSDSSTIDAGEVKVTGGSGTGNASAYVILGCFDTAPTTCVKDDKYYNTTTKKIYTATATNTWDAGATPENKVLYISKDDHKIYSYIDNEFQSYGRDDISETSNNAVKQLADGLYVQDLTSMLKDLSTTSFSGMDKGYFIASGDPNANKNISFPVNNSILKNLSVKEGDLSYSTDGYIKLTKGVWYLLAGSINAGVDPIKICWCDRTGKKYGSIGYTPAGASSDTNKDAIAIVRVETELEIAPTEIEYSAVVESAYSVVTVHRIGTTDVNPVAYLAKDGNLEETPIGNIISYMGKDVPKHYLPCDGSTYNITDYPELALHIKTQFGSYNYFGGDGIDTFAVPDLQGEFLRGTGTNSHTNQGNGADVGVHQDATVHPGLMMGIGNDRSFSPTRVTQKQVDSSYTDNSNPGTTDHRTWINMGTSDISGGNVITSRPTNTSVNYAIKYEHTYHAVIGDQTMYKVTTPISYEYINSKMTFPVFDSANAQDDISLIGTSPIGGNGFKAPMDGYYAYTFMLPENPDLPGNPIQYHAHYIYINSNLVGGTDRQDNSTNIRVPMNVSGIVKLKAGDVLTIGSYIAGISTNHTKTGTATFALVNSVSESKVAEIMNKPHLWPVGTEMSFGDGLYGRRFKVAQTSASTAQGIVQVLLNDSSLVGTKIVSWGGSCTGYNGLHWALPMAWKSCSATLYKSLDTSFDMVFVGTSAGAKLTDLDIWVTYTR